jgi:hypothetical protein
MKSKGFKSVGILSAIFGFWLYGASIATCGFGEPVSRTNLVCQIITTQPIFGIIIATIIFFFIPFLLKKDGRSILVDWFNKF